MLGSATLTFAGRQVTSALCPTAEPCPATAADVRFIGGGSHLDVKIRIEVAHR
jgi:hypothetical protein